MMMDYRQSEKMKKNILKQSEMQFLINPKNYQHFIQIRVMVNLLQVFQKINNQIVVEFQTSLLKKKN
jgi:hypothetical protein